MPRNDPADVFKHISMQGPDRCWPWAGAWGGRARDRRPYFMADGERTMAYRWVWRLTTGVDLQPGEMILHSCDNGGWPTGCCNPAHMRVGTHDDNMRDMTNRQRHGMSSHMVEGIRRLLDRGDTQQSIAHLYGVSRETISAIATGRVYKRGEPPEAATLKDSPGETDVGDNGLS